MRRFALIIVVCLTVIIGHAQEHLRFMDIPIEGTLDGFCSWLVREKGLVASSMTEEESTDMETRTLTGDFFDVKNCTFYVRKLDLLNSVSSIVVEKMFSAQEEVDVKKIISSLNEQYGKHEVDSFYYSVLWYTWETPNGDVRLALRANDYFMVYYTDYTEKRVRAAEIYDRQAVKEICGIPFGTSYEKTKEILEHKYGTPSAFSDKTRIHYSNKNYAGIAFNSIHFLFQSDGYKSYLNGCIFVWNAISLSQAKEKRDRLYDKLRNKYYIKAGIDAEGIKYYYGGLSPIPFDDIGFHIDIIKYDNSVDIPYAARLMFGTYNYVKEEF